MSYLVLARKYRPNTFDEVVGQGHITELLKKAILSDHIAHAYIFCGPRGIGKTSCARILAKSLNCKDAPTVKPCGQCAACQEIAQGMSFDVLEIDGASNRGIDEIRTIRENVKFAPSYGKFKIYIVDEVHMLTTEAFNALLKTLEEPPPHVKFIFATTDPNKIPATILSRCQRFDFKRIPFKEAVSALADIAKREKIQVEEDALFAIAKASGGSFRDSLSIMDQISALTSDAIKGADVYSMLGLVEMELLFELSGALGQKQCLEALRVFDEIIEKGKDVRQLGNDLIEHYRNLMVMRIGGKSLGKLLDYPIPIKEKYLAQCQVYSLKEILDAIDVLIKCQEISRVTETFRTPLEIAFAKITYRKSADTQAGPSLVIPSTAKEPFNVGSERSDAGPKKNAASNIEILKNEKGQVNVPLPDGAPDVIPHEEAETPAAEAERPKDAAINLSLESIKLNWGALTHAVSRKKMSVATYLQEGVPYSLEGNILTVCFAEGLDFYKESLEHKNNNDLIQEVLSGKLDAQIIVKYVIVQGAAPKHHEEDDPAVKQALKTFGGKIINKWHKE